MNIFSRLPMSRRAQREPKSLSSKVTDGVLTIDLYGIVGSWELNASNVADAIKYAGAFDSIVANIHSPGGQSFEGVAIFNILRNAGKPIHTRNVGLAASAASFIFMAGDTREMGPGTSLMIHEAWIYTDGRIADLQQAIRVLENVNQNYVTVMTERSDKTADEIKTIMADETWYTADEAVDEGFADTVGSSAGKANAQASIWDLNAMGYQHVPERLTSQGQKNTNPSDFHDFRIVNMTEAARVMEAFSLGGTTRATAEEPATDKEVTMTDKNQGTGQPGADDVVAAQAAATKAANDRITTFTEIAKEYGIPETLGTLLISCDTEADAKVRAIELKEIKSACVAAGTPDLFQEAVSNGLSKSSVTSLIAAAKGAKASGEEEVTTHRSGDERPTTAVNKDLDPKTIYGRRKAVSEK